MYVIREIMHCEPGKVRAMVDRFKELGSTMRKLGYEPFRLLTDVSGGRFWTVIAESEVESLDAALEMESAVMADEGARAAMAGYHDLIQEGRREIYKLET